LSPPNQQFYRDEHLFVDLRQQRVMLDSETVTLTRMEYRLLALLVKRAEEVVPRSILLKLTGPSDRRRLCPHACSFNHPSLAAPVCLLDELGHPAGVRVRIVE
jgi:hypothetical protein